MRVVPSADADIEVGEDEKRRGAIAARQRHTSTTSVGMLAVDAVPVLISQLWRFPEPALFKNSLVVLFSLTTTATASSSQVVFLHRFKHNPYELLFLPNTNLIQF